MMHPYIDNNYLNNFTRPICFGFKESLRFNAIRRGVSIIILIIIKIYN